jgi:para-nitrobenzyl esterase
MYPRRTVLAGVMAAGAMAALARAQGASPDVATAQGRVRGLIAGNGIYAFRGLPYGASTGGLNRFMPPKPPAGWTGVRDAVEYGPSAPQSLPGSTSNSLIDPRRLPESEDCLVLNVWTPSLDRNARKPVMVWLHGGGFQSGSASAPLYDGSNLARLGDVVMVGINHRLNVFGYTWLGGVAGKDFQTSGNAGNLDIVAALKWVRENIAAFGGDPGRVTIFGESGGGQKVTTLMATLPGKGLFHRAIAQSGPAFRVCQEADQDQAARAVMAKLGLQPGEIRKLQAVATVDLFKAYRAVLQEQQGQGAPWPVLRYFSPTLDGAAMAQHPYDPKAPAMTANVPLIIGYNHTEMTFFNRGREKFDLTDAEIAPRLERVVDRGADRVVAAYRQALPNASAWDLLMLINTDYPLSAYSREIAVRKTAMGPAPAYLYRFDYEIPLGGGRLHAPHTAELPFMFSNLKAGEVLVGTAPEMPALARRMSELWTTFARTGAPAAEGVPPWAPYDARTRRTLIIDKDIRQVADPDSSLRVAVDSALGLTV